MISFGKRVELFTDEYLIEKKEGIDFRYEKPEKLGSRKAYSR